MWGGRGPRLPICGNSPGDRGQAGSMLGSRVDIVFQEFDVCGFLEGNMKGAFASTNRSLMLHATYV